MNIQEEIDLLINLLKEHLITNLWHDLEEVFL